MCVESFSKIISKNEYGTITLFTKKWTPISSRAIIYEYKVYEDIFFYEIKDEKIFVKPDFSIKPPKSPFEKYLKYLFDGTIWKIKQKIIGSGSIISPGLEVSVSTILSFKYGMIFLNIDELKRALMGKGPYSIKFHVLPKDFANWFNELLGKVFEDFGSEIFDFVVTLSNLFF